MTSRKVALVARSGGAEIRHALELALALPLGGCDVVLVLEGAARELAAQPDITSASRPEEMTALLEALLADDSVEIVARVDAGEDPGWEGRLRPKVRTMGADEIEARCRRADQWLVV